MNHIIAGEDVEIEDRCGLCWERIKAAQNCPTCLCARDGTQDSTDVCWQDAHSTRLEKMDTELPL